MINNINRNYYDVGNNINTFNKNTLKQQIKAPSEQCEAVVTRMKDELQKSILIAIKIINEENITNTEEKFINTKYPDIKKLAEKLNKEIAKLKTLITNCDSKEEIKELINREIKNVKIMGNKGLISEVEVKLKLEVLSDIKKLSHTIKLENKKVEVIAIKLFKNEKLTSKEMKLIEQKVPNIKQIIGKISKDNKIFKDKIQNCNSQKEVKGLIDREIKNVKMMGNKKLISQIEFKLRLEALSDLKKLSHTIKLENKKVESIAIKLLKNEKTTSKEIKLIEEKIPNIKQIITKLSKENKVLEYEINNCTTNQEKQEKILNRSNYIESLFISNEISELELKLSIFYIKNLEKEINKDKNKQFWINPYFYLNTSSIVDNLSGVLIVIVIIIFILKFI